MNSGESGDVLDMLWTRSAQIFQCSGCWIWKKVRCSEWLQGFFVFLAIHTKGWNRHQLRWRRLWVNQFNKTSLRLNAHAWVRDVIKSLWSTNWTNVLRTFYSSSTGEQRKKGIISISDEQTGSNRSMYWRISWVWMNKEEETSDKKMILGSSTEM